jgi:hypothetical protein
MIYLSHDRFSRRAQAALQPLQLVLATAHCRGAEAVPGVQEQILEPAAGTGPAARTEGGAQ